jgi:hypothetical protein
MNHWRRKLRIVAIIFAVYALLFALVLIGVFVYYAA